MPSSELFERISKGQQEFDSIGLQYADLSGKSFEGLKFRNCKFYFVSMRHSRLKNVIFENCEFFFSSFGSSEFQNAEFLRCKMEYSGGTESKFRDSRMISTELSWHSFIDADLSGLEMKNCTEFHVIRSVSELTSSLAEKAMEELQPVISKLDFDMREKVKAFMETFAKRYSMKIPEVSSQKTKNKYGESGSSARLDGYRAFDALIDTAIAAYSRKSPYKGKSGIYEAKPNYR